MQEFLAYGYAAASMDRIASVAGVSKPTLYSYFQDKEGLFTALINYLTEGKAEIGVDPALFQLPLPDGLKQIATNVLDNFSREKPLLTLMRVMIGESGRFPALAQTFVRNIEKPVLEKITQLFAQHSDSHATDPEIMARMFMGSIIHYVITQEVLHGRDLLPMERSRYIDGLIKAMIQAVSQNSNVAPEE
ncbi:MAG: TetR/AcrR family transcriptional regulator [Oscillatoriales cyanobacterium SM2_3_0]|nr:TetR/AcrR family transcriptional regulator [Oscillatoriales cyanobacterium SM2_3_0]